MAKRKRLFFYRDDRFDLEECAALHQALTTYAKTGPDEAVTVEDIWTKLQRIGLVPV